MVKPNEKSYITKNDLNEAVDAILAGVDRMFQERDKKLDDHTKTLNEHSERLESIDTKVTFTKRDVNDIKADLSVTPSRKEFEELKSRVNKYHPLS